MKQLRAGIPFWETAPMFRLLLPLVAGILLYVFFPSDNSSNRYFITILAASSGLFLAISIVSFRQTRFKTVQFIVVQLLIAMIGFGLCVQKDIRRDKHYLGQPVVAYPATVAILSADPVEKKQTLQLQVSILAGINDYKVAVPLSGKGIVTFYKKEFRHQLNKGDTILLPGNWQPIQNRGNPFEFDYAGFCGRKQIYYQQFIRAEALSLWHKSKPTITARLHRYCIGSLEQYIKDPATAGLLKAMLAGDESGMDPELRQAYADTGIIHVISISGSHVNFLFLVVAFLLRPLKRKYQWAGFLLSGSLIWCYVLMAGSSAPAIRAALMFSIVAFGTLINRSSNPFNEWCTAAFLMLLYEPMWLLATGFQLSFTAILSIIIFYRPLRALWRPKARIGQWIADGLAVSIAAELLVAPLVAYYFHNFPVMFLIANLLACLAMMLLMLSGLLLILLSGIPAAATLAGKMISIIAGLFHSIIFALQRVSLPSLQTIVLHPLSLCLIYLIIAGIAVLLLHRRKAGLWLALIAALSLASCNIWETWQSGRQKVLVVYNHTGSPCIELIQGHSFFYYGNAGYEHRNENSQAHTGYRCYEAYPLKQHLFLINNRKILLTDSNDHYDHPFPAQVVIIDSWRKRASINDFIRGFHPEQVVLGRHTDRRAAADWAKACSDAGIALHDVKEKGACIFQQE